MFKKKERKKKERKKERSLDWINKEAQMNKQK